MSARLMQGNEAIAEGALAAGVRFFGGYPITPSTEIAEGMEFLCKWKMKLQAWALYSVRRLQVKKF